MKFWTAIRQAMILFVSLVVMAACSAVPVLIGNSDTQAPVVNSTGPSDQSIGVAINAQISATFSKAIDPTTITPDTFAVGRSDGTIVAGTRVMAISGYSITFLPSSILAADSGYVATLSKGVKDSAGNALSQSYSWSFKTGAKPDTTAPIVESVVPADASKNVAVNMRPAILFSKAMNPGTIPLAISVINATKGLRVAGVISLSADGHTAMFQPGSNFESKTDYSVKVSSGAQDLAGNILLKGTEWAFSTGGVPDIVAPTVLSTSPVVVSGAALNTNPAVFFSEAMDPLSVNATTFTLRSGTKSIAGSVSYAGQTAVFQPLGNLEPESPYTATISAGARDLAGNALAADQSWSFATGSALDTTAPEKLSTIPSAGSVDTAVNTPITVVFSETMNPASINSVSFTLSAGGSGVAGTVSCIGTTAVFAPTRSLLFSTAYSARITSAAVDLAGNALAADVAWNFTTGKAAAKGPKPVLLGTAATYAILSKAGTSTVPSSHITGNVGVSPAAATYLTGFSLALDGSGTFSTSSQVAGKVYAADYDEPTGSSLIQAVSDMDYAFADAAGRVSPDSSELNGGEIGGLTLVPGLYRWGAGLSINGVVTLDGGPDDVWIFQAEGGITVAGGASVVLSGGAAPGNVFWRSGSAVSIGAASIFKGIVLSKAEIVLGANATAVGRLFAGTAVTLISDSVSVP